MENLDNSIMDEIITLIDEDETEHDFAVEGFLELNNQRYAILVPLEDNDEDEAIILRFAKDENGDEVLVDIEDDDEWDSVAAAYDAFVAEESDGPLS